MPKRKTQEEFEREVKDFVGNEYSVLGEYKNNRTKLMIVNKKLFKYFIFKTLKYFY